MNEKKAGVLRAQSNQSPFYPTQMLAGPAELQPRTAALIAFLPALSSFAGRAYRSHGLYRVTGTGRDLRDHLVQWPPFIDAESERDNKGLPRVTSKLEARTGLNHIVLVLPPGLSFSLHHKTSEGSFIS